MAKKKRGGSGHTWSYYIKSIFIYISCLTCTIVLSKTTSKPAFPFPSRVPELQSPRRGLWRCGFLGVQRLPAFLPAVKPWTTMVLPWKSPKITEKDIYRRWILSHLRWPKESHHDTATGQNVPESICSRVHLTSLEWTKISQATPGHI